MEALRCRLLKRPARTRPPEPEGYGATATGVQSTDPGPIAHVAHGPFPASNRVPTKTPSSAVGRKSDQPNVNLSLIHI